MDDRRFDSLVKSFAGGASRRSVLKGLLGLGGAAVTGGALFGREASAARRPAPTATPPKCPGVQVWGANGCTCPPAAPNQCGPACCTGEPGDPQGPDHTECCDGACCHGLCFGEELCCPWPQTFCVDAQECCDPGVTVCCGEAGCCAGGCCQDGQGNDLCCSGDTPKCCAGDTCIAADGCCDASDCGPGECWSCVDHQCMSDWSKCAGGCVDCIDGTCRTVDANCGDGNACTTDTCNADGSCSQTFHCTSDDCCDDGYVCNTNTCNPDGTCAPPVVDCRNEGCQCFPSDSCHVASCNQETGTCEQVQSCNAECCADINTDAGCYSNGRCTLEGAGPDWAGTVQIGPCYYDVFCADVCCVGAFGQGATCGDEGVCEVPF